MSEPITLPNGVILRAPEDTKTLRGLIYDGAKKRLLESFPAVYNGVRMELHDLDYADPDEFSLAEQKRALLDDKFLSRRLRGTLRLIDDATNQPLDEKSMTLMRVPHLTDRGTFIYNGSEYAHVTQGRRRHGPYTRRQSNGLLETEFNVRPGSGASFRVNFEPSTAQYRLKVGGSNLHLYSLLKDLGTPDTDLQDLWGPEIFAQNQKGYDARVLDKAYSNLVPRRQQQPDLPTDQKVAAIRTALDNTQVSNTVVKRTLPSMLGTKAANAWRAELGIKMAETNGMVFAPDLAPAEALAAALEIHEPAVFYKLADFRPDLSPDEMREAYNAIYAKVGPQLAGMRQWPERWFPSEADPLGWISWYVGYGNGERSDDDARQIQRWKSFKARQGAQFKKNPTARRAYALRYWAIDPMQLLDDEETKKRITAEMNTYREEQIKSHESGKSATTSEEPPMMAAAMPAACDFSAGVHLEIDPWFDGVLKTAKAGPGGFRGCVMARFADTDIKKIITWAQDNIPESELAGDGYEREVHATVIFGIGPDVTAEEISEVIRDLRGRGKFPAFVKLGEIERFPAHDGRPESDVLVIHCDSPDLSDIHHAIREKFGDKVRVTYPTYRVHITLAYIKPGSLRDLDGHDYFEGTLLPVKTYVYSPPDRGDKVTLSTTDVHTEGN